MRRATWRRRPPAITVALMVIGCATAPAPEPRAVPESCQFVVYNQTPLALEIRLQVRAFATTPIGALNPGELLTHAVSCAQQRVWIAGIEIPWQVGAPLRFGVLYGSAELVEGDRVQIALHWP